VVVLGIFQFGFEYLQEKASVELIVELQSCQCQESKLSTVAIVELVIRR
jgi:hypothetical protein